MKKLFTLLTATILIFTITSCDKESKEAEYVVAVSGDDISDNSYILCQVNTNGLSPLKLKGGEATVRGTKKCKILFKFPSHTLNEIAPEEQTAGDKLSIKIFQSKKGKKKDQVGETAVTCSNYTEIGTPIEIEW